MSEKSKSVVLGLDLELRVFSLVSSARRQSPVASGRSQRATERALYRPHSHSFALSISYLNLPQQHPLSGNSNSNSSNSFCRHYFSSNEKLAASRKYPFLCAVYISCTQLDQIVAQVAITTPTQQIETTTTIAMCCLHLKNFKCPIRVSSQRPAKTLPKSTCPKS
ncbi:hypothetical protein ACLKA6_006674 [Drosophila palustris]